MTADRTQLTEDDEFVAWMELGIERKWISEPFCSTHDGAPLRSWEEEDFETGFDPCIGQVRIWRDGMPEESPWATTAP